MTKSQKKRGSQQPNTGRAGGGEVSPSERQQPPGEQQGESVLQQQAEQQKRAQESQQGRGDVKQNVGPGEDQPPLAPRDRE